MSEDPAKNPPRIPPPKAPASEGRASSTPGGPPSRPPGPPPRPAVRRQAPGVRGSQQAPEAATLKTGDVVGGRFAVERYLGSSGGGVSYLCVDRQTRQSVVVKVLDMPFPGEEAFAALSEDIRLAGSMDHRNLAAALGMGRTQSGEIFIAMEFVEGSTLSQLVAQRREEGRTLSIRDTFTVLAHVCSALAAVHQRKSCHGVLTPYNVYVNKQGVVRVGNLAFGRMVSTHLHGRGEGPFRDSIYVAPEVAQSPANLGPAADLYSLGMIAAELLNPTGLPSDRKQAHEMALDGLAKYPPALFSLISTCLASDPSQRPTSVQAFREELEEVARDAGAKLSGPPPAGALPIEPAVVEEEVQGESLFDLFDVGDIAPPPDEDGETERYLVQKSGLDYGPFTEGQILEQLYADEIHEHSLVLDRVTQERRPLIELDVFTAKVQAYIPEREERRRREAEARAELQRKVKQGGLAALVVGIVAGLVVLAAMGWFWLQQPDPEPMPLDKAFASLDYTFLPPPSEFQAVAVDADLLQSIFNPRASEEEIARTLKKVRGASGSRKGSAKAGGASGGTREADVDMANFSGSAKHLSDQEINRVIMADFSAMSDCIRGELGRDASFKGLTVQFFIRPSGTTGGVQIKESKYQSRPVGQCMIQRFRSMKFPEHGAISNRGVEFPLYVQ
ncbi:protein kinase domain-containing protein [Lujinxingia litoralis]|nr:protein kinase [Lujinxingia litoralis]